MSNDPKPEKPRCPECNKRCHDDQAVINHRVVKHGFERPLRSRDDDTPDGAFWAMAEERDEMDQFDI